MCMKIMLIFVVEFVVLLLGDVLIVDCCVDFVDLDKGECDWCGGYIFGVVYV